LEAVKAEPIHVQVEQRGADVRFVFVSDKGHNLRSRFVFDLIYDWMRSLEPPSTS
jgi:hypothetical protein